MANEQTKKYVVVKLKNLKELKDIAKGIAVLDGIPCFVFKNNYTVSIKALYDIQGKEVKVEKISEEEFEAQLFGDFVIFEKDMFESFDIEEKKFYEANIKTAKEIKNLCDEISPVRRRGFDDIEYEFMIDDTGRSLFTMYHNDIMFGHKIENLVKSNSKPGFYYVKGTGNEYHESVLTNLKEV